jgi:hypothetical protein
MLVRLLSMAARGTAGEEEPGDLTGRSENGVLNLHEVSQSERGASSQKPGKNRARFGRGKVEPRYERPIARKYIEQGARGGTFFLSHRLVAGASLRTKRRSATICKLAGRDGWKAAEGMR